MTRWNSFLRILLQLEFLGQLIFIKRKADKQACVAKIAFDRRLVLV